MAVDQSTSFSLDTLGRFLCNTLQEALHSAGINTGLGNPPAGARPFDVIVAGGGTFGAVIAQHLLANDKTGSRRILVLESGPFVLPEHVQNLPFGDAVPGFREPWVSNLGNPIGTPKGGFTGLLFGVGGRSMKWGGWSPELLDGELNDWPLAVRTELKAKYFKEASNQIGVTDTNDFIFGPLHRALRRQLYEGLQPGISNAAAFAQLQDHPKLRFSDAPLTDADLIALFDLPGTFSSAELRDIIKLEAPLAVQSRTEPGLFPVNKFSSIPVLAGASRKAADESFPFDELKRLMVVSQAHVLDLVTQTQPDNSVTVTGVRVANNPWSDVIPLAPGGVVIVALGTIESTRLAQQTFNASLAGRAAERIGQNLMAHLRSNLDIRLPRTSLKHLPAAVVQKALQASALLVKGKATINGRDRFFHIQITASGLASQGDQSEAELFKKIPDLDGLNTMLQASDTHVVITLRGIGEMLPGNPDSRIEPAKFDTDNNRAAAWVTIGNAKLYAEKKADPAQDQIQVEAQFSAETKSDAQFWEAMDRFTDELALVFADGKPFELLSGQRVIPVPAGATATDLTTLRPYLERRDGLGSTHHEAGTLRMGDNVATSVTDGFGKLHDTTNCYFAGPALFPTIGSPNPMLTGVALARRTADHLSSNVLPQSAVFTGDGIGWQVLFDGTSQSFRKWQRVGVDKPDASQFKLVDGQLVSYGQGDFALLYFPQPFADFILKLQFAITDPANHNSGIFLRFRNPKFDLPEPISARAAADLKNSSGNRAWTAVHSGFEVQLDDTARGDSRVDFYGIKPEPDGLWKNRTGAIYKIPAGDRIWHLNQNEAKTQDYQPGPALQPGTWFEYEIKVQGDSYEVFLGRADGSPKVRTTSFVNPDKVRGLSSSADLTSGYLGLQAYSNSRVAFRHIQIKAL